MDAKPIISAFSSSLKNYDKKAENRWFWHPVSDQRKKDVKRLKASLQKLEKGTITPEEFLLLVYQVYSGIQKDGYSWYGVSELKQELLNFLVDIFEKELLCKEHFPEVHDIKSVVFSRFKVLYETLENEHQNHLNALKTHANSGSLYEFAKAATFLLGELLPTAYTSLYPALAVCSEALKLLAECWYSHSQTSSVKRVLAAGQGWGIENDPTAGPSDQSAAASSSTNAAPSP